MKQRKSLIVVLISAALIFCATASAQRKRKADKPRPQPAQPSEEMQKEMANAAPGAEHGRLAKLAGEYTTLGKFTPAPGAPAIESTGQAKLSMTLDDRFLIEEDIGTFAGQPSKSFKMLGYNNASKRYEGIWTYTMSTAIMSLNGTSSDGGKTISFNASWDEEGGAKHNLQIVMRQTDEDHFSVELSEKSADGKPGPVFLTNYTRKPKNTFGG